MALLSDGEGRGAADPLSALTAEAVTAPTVVVAVAAAGCFAEVASPGTRCVSAGCCPGVRPLSVPAVAASSPKLPDICGSCAWFMHSLRCRLIGMHLTVT